MKSKLQYITIALLLLTASSCKKNLTVNAITVGVSTNDTLSFLRFYDRCDAGPNGMPSGSYNTFDDHGNGNYSIKVEEGYQNNCFMVAGAIAANTDSTGTTVLNIDAYYSEEGNIVGFQEIELKRPHGEHQIRYEFKPDTYVDK